MLEPVTKKREPLHELSLSSVQLISYFFSCVWTPQTKPANLLSAHNSLFLNRGRTLQLFIGGCTVQAPSVQVWDCFSVSSSSSCSAAKLICDSHSCSSSVFHWCFCIFLVPWSSQLALNLSFVCSFSCSFQSVVPLWPSCEGTWAVVLHYPW